MVVAAIEPTGPAFKSDLKVVDVNTAVDGKSVSTAQQLRNEIRGKKIGQPVTLDVFREGKAIQVKVNPAEQADLTILASGKRPSGGQSDPAGAGLTVHALTHELANQYGVKMVQGVIVIDVEKD